MHAKAIRLLRLYAVYAIIASSLVYVSVSAYYTGFFIKGHVSRGYGTFDCCVANGTLSLEEAGYTLRVPDFRWRAEMRTMPPGNTYASYESMDKLMSFYVWAHNDSMYYIAFIRQEERIGSEGESYINEVLTEELSQLRYAFESYGSELGRAGEEISLPEGILEMPDNPIRTPAEGAVFQERPDDLTAALMLVWMLLLSIISPAVLLYLFRKRLYQYI